jgi:hypothetical protein
MLLRPARVGLDAGAFEVEGDGHVVPAAVHFADDLAGRDAHIFEEDFVEAVAVRSC